MRINENLFRSLSYNLQSISSILNATLKELFDLNLLRNINS
ncbi:hypothetical protein PPBDW_p0060 (plasmid) [Photobacterium kishitanii]|nr:hypothetical protein PPBDW_p0060 [Photobacterium kishitanii]